MVASVDFDSVSTFNEITTSPNDPYFTQQNPFPNAVNAPQWGLERVNMELAWSAARSRGLKGGVTIAVLDSGITEYRII